MERRHTPHPACIIDGQRAGICEFVGCGIKMAIEVIPGNAPSLGPSLPASFCMSRCLEDAEQPSEEGTNPGQQNQ